LPQVQSDYAEHVACDDGCGPAVGVCGRQGPAWWNPNDFQELGDKEAEVHDAEHVACDDSCGPAAGLCRRHGPAWWNPNDFQELGDEEAEVDEELLGGGAGGDDGSPPLTSGIIRQHRKTKRKLTTWVGLAAGSTADTLSICAVYDVEGYGSMNQDTIRNKVYERAIKATSRKGANVWVDVGCGASACLTKMVLTLHGQCVAIEANPISADTAMRVLLFAFVFLLVVR
jgi:hypothetical protein